MRAPARCAVLRGVGGYVPPAVVTNHDLAARLGTSDAWIRGRTGVSARHAVAPGTATSDLAVEAGARALASAGGAKADALVLATTTPDRISPATAPEVASRLGLEGVAAFDIGAVCSGFLYGLAVAAGLISAGTAGRVLVIGADAFTTVVDPADRTTAVVFGDGAGAVVLTAGGAGEPGAVGPAVLGSDGGLRGLIEIPAGGSRQRSSGLPAEPGGEFLKMRGPETFRQAVGRMGTAARQAVAAAGWDVNDVERFAAHQANGRILTAVADELGIPPQGRLSNIARVGNTGAASIPLLLAQSAADGSLTAGHRLLMTAFGGGLTWAATTMVWPETGVG